MRSPPAFPRCSRRGGSSLALTKQHHHDDKDTPLGPLLGSRS